MSTPKPAPRSTPDTPFAVECRGLVKRYEDLVAVAGVDLAVERGECFGLLGPNGAGKTTTVEMLEGLTDPDEGSVVVLGESWGRGRDHRIRQRLGVQLQDNQIADKLTVEEVLRLFASFYDKAIPVNRALGMFDLTAKAKTRYHKLSGGQKQRLSLACALISQPELVFLDEPTTGLDPQARNRVWELVGEFRERGGTVVLTTHYMEEAEKLCDRLAILDHGRIIIEGAPADLIADLGAAQVVQFRVSSPAVNGAFDGLPGVTSITKRDDAFWLTVSSVEHLLPALIQRVKENGWELDYLRTHQPTLDDVFLEHTGRALRDE